MIRVSDPAYLNAVANHSQVRPWLGGEGDIDLAAILADEANYALQFDGGGFVYVNLGNDVYEVHSLFRPDAATSAVDAARQGLDYMFSQTECREVMTRVPGRNKAALGLARICAFQKLYERPNGWNGDEDLSVWTLTLDRWAMTSGGCLTAGEDFHELLDKAGVHSNHPEDPAHDQAAGAVALMFKAGRDFKAVAFYNKWCAVSGYLMINLASIDPPIMDIGDAKIGLKSGELEVL